MIICGFLVCASVIPSLFISSLYLLSQLDLDQDDYLANHHFCKEGTQTFSLAKFSDTFCDSTKDSFLESILILLHTHSRFLCLLPLLTNSLTHRSILNKWGLSYSLQESLYWRFLSSQWVKLVFKHHSGFLPPQIESYL